MEKELSSLKELHHTLFGKSWPAWIGGILLGLGNVLLFVVRSPWGGSGGYIQYGQNFYGWLGWGGADTVTPVFRHPYALLNTVIVLGAFAAALLAREFAMRIPPAWEMVKGFLGGCLMAVGATVGMGCTIGGFLSGWPALSGGALVMAGGFLAGTWIAVRYLLWEVETLSGLISGRGKSLLAGTGSGGRWQPWLGGAVWIGALITAGLGYRDDPVLLWFAVIGLLFGLILQRSRFCIVRAFREPFLTGDSSAAVGVIAALVVGILGFTVIKTVGLRAVDPDSMRRLAMVWVNAHFWMKALIGGTVFGLGMTLAGGCAVGTLWRMGEGQIKLWLAAGGFVLMGPLSRRFIVPPLARILPEWGDRALFLPDQLGYWGALLLLFGLLLLWYVFVKWNERTGKFSAL